MDCTHDFTQSQTMLHRQHIFSDDNLKGQDQVPGPANCDMPIPTSI